MRVAARNIGRRSSICSSTRTRRGQRMLQCSWCSFRARSSSMMKSRRSRILTMPERPGRISRFKDSIRVWSCTGCKASITIARAKNFKFLMNSESKRWRRSANQGRKKRCLKNYRRAKVRTIGAKFPKAFSRARSSLIRNSTRRARFERDNGDYSQHHRSAQNFHGIAAYADVGDARALPRCSDIHLTRTTALDALANQHLFITLCDSVLDHPTGSAAGRRSCGRVFTAVKKHSSSSFKPVFASFGTQEVEKVSASILQEFRCLSVSKLQIRQCLLMAEWHNREGQSCRDGLYWPFRRNLVNGDSNDASDFLSRKCSSEFGLALAHFTEHLAVDSITAGTLRIRSEAHRNFPG